MRTHLLSLATVLILVSVVTSTVLAAEGVPPFPVIYSGDAKIQGDPVQAGLPIVACLDGCSNWQSEPVESRYGRYVGITVGPPSSSYLGKDISFHVVTEFGIITANETIMYAPGLPIARTLDITFNDDLPTPPPTATPEPTSIPTITPMPLPTPVLPIPGDQIVMKLPGVILYSGIGAIALGLVSLLMIRRWNREV